VTRNPTRRAAARGFEHVTIECVSPEVDAGRHPAKRIVGDAVAIGADIFRDGHDLLAARVLYKNPSDTNWRQAPLTFDYNEDRWFASIALDVMGRWTFTVEAWTDAFATWRDGLKKKHDAGVDVQLELLEGANIVKSAAKGLKPGPTRAMILQTANLLADRRESEFAKRIKRALDPELAALMREHWKPVDLTRYARELTIVVDQPKARFSSWYEFFPRSCGTQERGNPERSEGSLRHGTFADAARELPRIAKLGFDVVYLPPIHPIGRTFRKGKNNSLEPRPDDVGSPWAIGNEHGGHTAIEPALGTIDDFDAFVAAAKKLNIDVSLDYALQCSPDHPWVKEHPDWFHIRPDGSIAYAENPPKKYQDIYPINFWSPDRENLWKACRDVVLYWIDHGVKIFRVDNPHTKAFAFWEWMIADVQAKHPDAVFFAEAFTRPKRMKKLAKLGFTMSYTYFTWKNEWWDLRAFMEEVLNGGAVEYYRPNFFVNTPDILNEYLVAGGRPAFRIRLLLAATLSSLYGMYSGYELIENVPVKKGSEEYLDSEKYQLRHRDWNAAGNINADIALVNRLRREQRALQRLDNVTFHESENPAVLFYSKAANPPARQWLGHWQEVPTVIPSGSVVIPSGSEGSARHVSADPSLSLGMTGAGLGVTGPDLFIAVTTDWKSPQESMVHVPLAQLGLGDDDQYVLRDLLTDQRYTWRGSRNYVRLDPTNGPVAHIFAIERKA
jgi:starch synthase (maltosyl-transferring)